MLTKRIVRAVDPNILQTFTYSYNTKKRKSRRSKAKKSNNGLMSDLDSKKKKDIRSFITTTFRSREPWIGQKSSMTAPSGAVRSSRFPRIYTFRAFNSGKNTFLTKRIERNSQKIGLLRNSSKINKSIPQIFNSTLSSVERKIMKTVEEEEEKEEKNKDFVYVVSSPRLERENKVGDLIFAKRKKVVVGDLALPKEKRKALKLNIDNKRFLKYRNILLLKKRRLEKITKERYRKGVLNSENPSDCCFSVSYNNNNNRMNVVNNENSVFFENNFVREKKNRLRLKKKQKKRRGNLSQRWKHESIFNDENKKESSREMNSFAYPKLVYHHKKSFFCEKMNSGKKLKTLIQSEYSFIHKFPKRREKKYARKYDERMENKRSFNIIAPNAKNLK